MKQLLDEVPDGPENIRRNIRDFRKGFALLLEKADIKRLVVFIDDLDRCLPENIIETLEAIKLFLFVPGTAFIIGADERLVQYAVRQRFPELPGPKAEVGRDYLEKLIQIPIRLPALNAAELESYLNLLFADRDLSRPEFTPAAGRLQKFLTGDLAQAMSIPLFSLERARTLFEGGTIPVSFESDLDLGNQIAPILAPGLGGNPRRTKRFLNTLMLSMVISEDRSLPVKRRVLVKLMLLEYLKPKFFRQLAQLQSQQDGKPEELPLLEKHLQVPYPAELDEQVLPQSRETGFRANIAETMPCAHPGAGRFSGTKEAYQHCGYCLPCLVRRASIDSFMRDPTAYRVEDLRTPLTPTRRSDLRACKLALDRYRAQTPKLKDILMAGPLHGSQGAFYAYLDLYRRGLAELERFLTRVA